MCLDHDETLVEADAAPTGFNRRRLIYGAGIAGVGVVAAATSIGVASAAPPSRIATIAIWDPVTGRSTSAIKPVRVIVHITAGRAEDPFGPNKGSGSVYPHFHSSRSGVLRQHQELDRRGAADGNSSGISVEHEGRAGDDMTPSQLENMAKVFAWAVVYCGVPNRIATANDTRGLAWHRLGVEGNFPAYDPNNRKTWCRRDTGMVWSSAFGKACPTDAFIDKIPAIFNRAQDWIKVYSGGSVPPAPTTPPPTNPPTTPPPAGGSGWTAIKQGNTTWRTGVLQHLLKHRGFYSLNVDNDFGPRTRDAVIAFQRANGLAVDGIVGSQTWPRVIVQVQKGSTGERARAAQRALNAYGAGLTIDGDFGSQSTGALKRFQAANGLSQDGVLGPITWNRLI